MKLMIASLLAMATVAAVGCKKRKLQEIPPQYPIDDVVLPPPPTQDIMMARPGNYWVYRSYRIMPDGREEVTGTTDTTRVEKDTMIGKRLYHKMVRSSMGTRSVELIADSNGYVINGYGKIIYSNTDFSNVFAQRSYYQPLVAPDTIATVREYMGDRNLVVNVPVGTYNTNSFIEAYHMRPPHDNYGKVRSYYYRYARGVGLVSYTTGFYLASPDVFENRLVQYKVE